MYRYYVVTVAAIAGCAVLAGAQTGDTRRDVAPGSPWVTDDATCEIDVLYPDQSGVIISIHDDHHDLQIYDTRLKGIVNDKAIKVKYTAGEPAASAGLYDALGVHKGQSNAYIGTIRDDLLVRVAASNRLRMYRDGALIADLDMKGFKQAYASLQSCADAMPSATDAMKAVDDTMESEDASMANAVDAYEPDLSNSPDAMSAADSEPK